MILYEVDTPKYQVRIHAGKRTEEERKEVLTNAAKAFYMAIQADIDRDDRCCPTVKQ